MNKAKGKKPKLRRIIFIRHGIAMNREDFQGQDCDRPLTKKGITKMKKIAKSMAALFFPNLIVSSDYKRARETAEICVKAFAKYYERSLVTIETKAIRPDASWDQWVSALDRICDEYPNASTVMVVGHEPSLSALLAKTIGARPEVVTFKKSGIAVIERDETSLWRLIALIPPTFWGN